ncbi:sialin-like isoform X1 [Biomphalaria glabrata]|uniref:Sialin-like isoform X1 n=1 Tax=Biomphalaria glabrata TaxID=6526 RepID=A0A9W2YPT5_BIOGL|nr:sialin-like isoform X1 [Biomphalaria glabrata]XP_055864732.1 sialin-like isoform X1 [Biomphalaria glabrata]XP_055864733.1 sialin-like isoform X1 [Biomphalaria glabrata]XP_055864734.1 sialin-like isoform X1 [Biomphalaria glabrata]XP_055864735.1 sialin-like isoform X1 [Biomphalaria glabrata]
MLELDNVPIFFSHRLLLSCLACLGTLMVYVTRVNLSVAIICMVRSAPANDSLDVLNASSTGQNNVTSSCGSDVVSANAGAARERAEFDWDKNTRAQLLAMYFYGYISTQILSGWLASRYGGTRVWAVSMFICALCTLITPVCARTHVYLVYAARVIIGVSSGVSFPCIQAILGRWAPVYEKSKLASIIYAGLSAGNIITFAISGLMCEYGFDNGWGSIFYLSGLFTILWVASWFVLTSDTPAKHRWVSAKERTYIETAIGKGGLTKVRSVPWLKMFKSGPLWAVTTAHFCNNYVNYTLLTLLPTFLKESLNFDIKQNGLLSSLPYISEFLASLCVGYVADTIRQKKIMSTKTVRKSFQFFGFIGTAICTVSVGQMTCEQRHYAVLLLCITTACMSFNRAGYVVNHQDLAPSYAGVLYGITNTAGTLPGMIAPIIAGALTPNKTTEEWKNVFYVCAANAVFGAIVYVVLADGELQEWAVPPEIQIKMDIVAQYTNENISTSGEKSSELPSENKQNIYTNKMKCYENLAMDQKV